MDMTLKEMEAIWNRHNTSKCDCSNGDAYHNEPECYIAMGFLKGHAQGAQAERKRAEKLIKAIESFIREKEHIVKDPTMILNTYRWMKGELSVYQQESGEGK